MNLTNLIADRRSIYALGKNIPVEEETINDFVKQCVSQCPSAFNSQTSKVVILYQNKHDALWELLADKMKQLLPPEALEDTLSKIYGFKAAYATILFYENQEIIKGLEAQFPRYAHNFQPWSQQASGMLQFAVWTGLKELGLGANVQHYNELFEKELLELVGIDPKYKLIGQMPFGEILQPADEKTVDNLEERFCVKR